MIDNGKFIAYNPRIKDRGFCPNPIVRYGIPAYADSVSYPDVVKTVAWEDWWFEQFEYCINGYDTGGLHIPGRYYFLLNFYPIYTVGRGKHYADFTDTDFDLFELIDYAKANYKGIIVAKARRRLMSEVAGCITNHGMRFRPEGYKAAVIAGLTKYSEELMQKVTRANPNMPQEMKLSMLKGDDENIIAGWEEETLIGWEKKGSLNEVVAKTVFNNPNVMKGSLLDDCFYEESGENKWLIETMGATKNCYMDGTRMVGTPYVYGTGGNIATGSKGFMDVWSEAEHHHLLRFRMYGDRKCKPFFVGCTDTKGKPSTPDQYPNIEKLRIEQDLSIEQVLGCEDVWHARENIMNLRQTALKQKNKQPYFDSLQNDPLNDAEVFLRFGSNDYDVEELTKAKQRILEEPLMAHRYTLRWATNEDGTIKRPLSVIMDSVPDEYEPDCWIEIYKKPLPGFRNLYSGGLDGYDIDKSSTSKSIGGFVIIGRKSTTNKVKWGEVQAMIRCRPKRKETFYEYCGMASVLYNLKGATMADARSPLVIDWYIKNGLESYLASRPIAFDSPNSEQDHKYGYKETTFTKNPGISMVQSWVLDCAADCWFYKLIADISDYDTSAKDSDWDAHDALKLALICDFHISIPATPLGNGKFDPFELVSYSHDANGGMIVSNPEVAQREQEQEMPNSAEIMEMFQRGWE